MVIAKIIYDPKNEALLEGLWTICSKNKLHALIPEIWYSSENYY